MKMKNQIRSRVASSFQAFFLPPTTIARFGRASLIKHFDGPYELIGGTAAERAAAREWCCLFAPQVVFASAQPAPTLAMAE